MEKNRLQWGSGLNLQKIHDRESNENRSMICTNGSTALGTSLSATSCDGGINAKQANSCADGAANPDLVWVCWDGLLVKNYAANACIPGATVNFDPDMCCNNGVEPDKAGILCNGGGGANR